MANQNPLYFTAPALQQFFRDKTTNLPLAGGEVWFYIDVDRRDPEGLKPVYKQVGDPINGYDYSALPNPMILSTNGSYEDGGIDIQVYWNPFDAEGKAQPYYVEVYAGPGKTDLQYTYENVPSISESQEADTETADNYIANGQLVAHTNVPGDPTATPVIPPGQIPNGQEVTNFAYGGFKLVRVPATTTAIDTLTFIEETGYSTNPEQSPRYRAQLVNSVPAAGTGQKDIVIEFDDANKFTSPPAPSVDEVKYTFLFNATTNGNGTIPVDFKIRRFYGSGGAASTADETDIITFQVGPSPTNYSAIFSFGDNAGKTIEGGDDWVQLVLRLPLDAAFTFQATDFLLEQGAIASPVFPVTTTRQAKTEGIGGGVQMPDYDSNDLGLPLILGPTGYIFDQGAVGDIVYNARADRKFGQLPTDGAKYIREQYHPVDKIPFSRLGNFLYSPVLGYPIFGTGPDYFLAQRLTPNDIVLIVNNSSGVVADSADGALPTGYTITTAYKATALDHYIDAFHQTDNNLIVNWRHTGHIAPLFAPDAVPGTTGALFYNIQQAIQGAPGATGRNINQPIVGMNFVPIAAPSLYWEYTAVEARATGVPAVGAFYTMWYTLNGAGTVPVGPGGTPIKVDVLATYTGVEVGILTKAGINNRQATTIKATAPTAPQAGTYFDVNSTGAAYRVWLTVDGAGAAPAAAGKILIQVALLTTDTAAAAALKITETINRYSYAVPDTRDLLIKSFVSGTSAKDSSAIWRYSDLPGLAGEVGGVEGFYLADNDRVSSGANQSPTQSKIHYMAEATNWEDNNPMMRPDNLNIYFATFIKY